LILITYNFIITSIIFPIRVKLINYSIKPFVWNFFIGWMCCITLQPSWPWREPSVASWLIKLRISIHFLRYLLKYSFSRYLFKDSFSRYLFSWMIYLNGFIFEVHFCKDWFKYQFQFSSCELDKWFGIC
jgi:hypothetical protein